MTQPRRKVVLVEDDPDARELLVRTLRRLGYEVWSAADGEMGLSLIDRYKPDLVCLDLSLPHISGFDVCELLRANAETRNTPVLITTGRLSPQDRALAEMLGADDYLTKPFSLSVFMSVVERLMSLVPKPVSLNPEVRP